MITKLWHETEARHYKHAGRAFSRPPSIATKEQRLGYVYGIPKLRLPRPRQGWLVQIRLSRFSRSIRFDNRISDFTRE
jgi:hypothetical protein